jgi:methionine-gamma-lyase
MCLYSQLLPDELVKNQRHISSAGDFDMSKAHDRSGGFSTRAIHFGYNPAEHHGRAGAAHPHLGHLCLPRRSRLRRALLCRRGKARLHLHRIANPTLALLEGRLASLEQGAAPVVFGSGMGAITATLWSMLEPGDEVLADITLYGCTFAFLHHGLARFGVTVRHVDMTDPQQVAAMG